MSIKVNYENADGLITKLNNLHQRCETYVLRCNDEVQGSGNTVDSIIIIRDSIKSIQLSLSSLINNTSVFLSNSIESIKETDDKIASQINKR